MKELKLAQPFGQGRRQRAEGLINLPCYKIYAISPVLPNWVQAPTVGAAALKGLCLLPPTFQLLPPLDFHRRIYQL